MFIEVQKRPLGRCRIPRRRIKKISRTVTGTDHARVPRSAKWAFLNLMNIFRRADRRVVSRCCSTGTHFSVSSGVGFLALFGASVQIGVIMVEYINQLRARGRSVVDAAVEGTVAPLAAHHDDHAGSHARPAAGSYLARHLASDSQAAPSPSSSLVA